MPATGFPWASRHSVDLGRDTDVVLMRQDPPFDMAYITATHLLEQVQGESLVVNDPAHVRNAPEKLFVTRFPDLTPPTLITRSVARIKAFRTTYKDMIVKPLFGNGGAGIFRITEEDQNLDSLLEMYFSQSREMLIIQQYIPGARSGDKRIILVDGKPVGAVNRVPAEGQARSNICVGGHPQATQTHRAGSGNLRSGWSVPEGKRSYFCRHRCDRKLSYRN